MAIFRMAHLTHCASSTYTRKQSIFLTLKFFFIKNLLWKIWPISVKQWKPVWIRAWKLGTLQFTFHLHVRSFIIRFKRNETLLDISWDMNYIRPCVKFVKETIRHKSKELTRDGSHQNFVLIIRKQKSYATTVKTSVCYKFNSLFLDNVPIISCMS